MDKKQPPHKRRKLETTKKFTSADQIRQGLRAQGPDLLVDVLNQLRNQLTIRPDEGRVEHQDDRLLLLQEWLEKSPGGQDLFSLWEDADPRQPALSVAIVSLFAAILTLLSSHYTYYAAGYPVVKALLTPQWMRRLNSYVGGSHNELVLVTLKLFNAISGFAGGKEKKALLEVFQWEMKTLPKLLTLRRKGKVDYNPLLRPDIRTLYVLFLLSFLEAPTPIKITFLEQHRDAFLAMFKGLAQDHYALVRHILETIWTHIWVDPKIKRTTKVGLFHEVTISHLLKLYERTGTGDDNPEHAPADLAHHFLLAITTRPGTGICFKDRGWYPREDPEDEKGGKIYNKILANVLKTLKVNEDSRQQELARRILEACPELVTGYRSGAQLTLEPRLSTKWIANISFFGTIISLPVPQNTFFLPDTQLYNPTPPPLLTILSNILPSDISPKTIFTKGLQSHSGLVQHCSALALAKCLIKYARVLESLKSVEDALEVADTDEGQWGRRRREVEKEVRKRVPEFQVIVGFLQQKSAPMPSTGTNAALPASNSVKNALLQESAQRLLFLYHKYLPEVVVEARFDVGKALSSFSVDDLDGVNEGDERGHDNDAAKRLHLIQQLHALRTLKESDHFIWTNKTSPSRTYLYTLLKSYAKTSIHALRVTLLDLITHLLSNSIPFQETSAEARVWLHSLPRLIRSPDALSPDKAKLSDETESVVTFLDDCIQRCLRTPFRYIEEMHALLLSPSRLPADSEGENLDHTEIWPSPLVMTVGEQLDAKLKAGLLTPSDVLAIASFVRKLLFSLSGQLQDLRFLEAFVAWMGRTLSVERLWMSEYPMMTDAVRREVEMMYMIFKPMEPAAQSVPRTDVRELLDEVEKQVIALGGTHHHPSIIGHLVIDRLRFIDQPLPPADMHHLIHTIEKHYKPALIDLAEYLLPRSGSLWQDQKLVGPSSGQNIPTKWIFHNSTKVQMHDPNYRRTLVTSLFSRHPTLQDCLELITLVQHRLGAAEEEGRGLLSLLAILISEASSVFKEADMAILKERLFVCPGAVKRLAMTQGASHEIQSGLREVLQSSFDPRSAVDRRILLEVSAWWLALVHDQLDSGIHDKYNDAALWIKYLSPTRILHLLDRLTAGDAIDSHTAPLLRPILDVIQASIDPSTDTENMLRERIPQFLKILKQFGDSPVAEDLLFSAVDSTLPVGYALFSWNREIKDSVPLAKLVQQAELRWTHRTRPLGCTLPLEDFLQRPTWTSATVKIISSLLYKQHYPLESFQTWLKSEHAAQRSTEHLAIVVQAALDVQRCVSPDNVFIDADVWIHQVSKISNLCFDHNVEPAWRRAASSCVSLALDQFKQHQEKLVKALTQQLQSQRKRRPSLDVLQIGCQHPLPELTSTLLEQSLQWLIEQLANDSSLSVEATRIIEKTTALVQHATSAPTHLVETLLGVVVQDHLSHAPVITLVTECLSRAHLKPVVVNRHIQGILQHPQFVKLSADAGSEPSSRARIVKLLHALYNLHPANTCQVTHVEPLLQIYYGTLSKEDLLLFSILQLFELQRKISLAPLFSCWSSSKVVTSSSALEGLQSLDPARILRTALHFPRWRKLQNDRRHEINSHDAQLYDPIFLVLLFHLVLSENRPLTAFGWVELFRTNIVGFCFRLLSAKDARLRELGLSQITSLYKCIETVEFQEKGQTLYILNLFKDLFPAPAKTNENEAPRRLPSYTTLFLTHALRGTFYPSNFTYPLTARFLLQRPALDANDIFMLYNMLYSNSDDWKKERGWIIRYLSDGMASSDDWRILKRRHTWDLLASIFQGSEGDHVVRKGVFEVLANLTCHTQAVMSMILKSSLLTWMEMQISRANENEAVVWTRILGNITLSADKAKLDLVLKTAWRDQICRCITNLLSRSHSELVLPNATSIIFRLSLLSDPLTNEFENTIAMALKALRNLETQLDYPHVRASRNLMILDHERCPGYAIHEPIGKSDPHQLWLECTTLLWRATMNLSSKIPAWDSLTCRLMINQNSEAPQLESEWARREVVSCIHKNENM